MVSTQEAHNKKHSAGQSDVHAVQLFPVNQGPNLIILRVYNILGSIPLQTRWNNMTIKIPALMPLCGINQSLYKLFSMLENNYISETK